MRYIYLLLISFSFFACKKKTYRNFKAGYEKNMIITEVNETINIHDTELIPDQKININLDGTGIYDISFRCDHDTNHLDTSEVTWHIYMKTLNDNFRMYSVQVDSYLSYSESLVDSNPDAPIIEAEKTYSCEPREGAELNSTDFFLKSFPKDEKINFKDYEWIQANPFLNDPVSIAKKFVEPVVVKDENYYDDTLVRTNTNFTNNCQNEIIKNEKQYFIFKEVSQYEDEKNLGWIEYELTDNQFTIYRVAISNKLLRE